MAGAKHTTIVVVDVAGFSALAKADQARAVEAVTRLIERCTKVSAAHGGRVFDTSGDSVLMQFPGAAKGLAAAADLAAEPDPPIRAAVHVGEATELPTGDLIGDGVKTAAHLQAHAQPGGVLVSDDARKALHGGLADRLVVKGVIKLDKAEQTIAVYELAVTPRRSARADAERARRFLRLGVAGGIALIVLLGFALVAWPLLRPEPATRMAVFALTAPNDGALRTLAVSISDDIGLSLSGRGVDTVAREPRDAVGDHNRRIARARALGAPLLLDGGVERADGAVRVTLAVTRVADRAALWTSTFEQASGEALDDLRRRAAAQGVDAAACAADAQHGQRSPLAAGVLEALLRACTLRGEENAAERRALLTQVAGQAPNLGVAQAALAFDNARASLHGPQGERETLREDARRQAHAAINRDRRLVDAYLALELVEARRNWNAREGALLQGLEHNAHSGALAARHAEFLVETGRIAEAVDAGRRASELEPLSITHRLELASALILSGDPDAAQAISDELSTLAPNDPDVWLLRLRLAFWGGRYDEVETLLNAPNTQVRSTRARLCWRQSAAAMQSTPETPARQAGIVAIRDCGRSGDLPAQQALMMFSSLGAMDEAFAFARTHFIDDQNGGQQVLFAPQARALRGDARFMPLMRDLGLVRHWRLSGHWPDFCRDPALPYQCDAAARRLL